VVNFRRFQAFCADSVAAEFVVLYSRTRRRLPEAMDLIRGICVRVVV
jgi:hypothetical protein